LLAYPGPQLDDWASPGIPKVHSQTRRRGARTLNERGRGGSGRRRFGDQHIGVDKNKIKINAGGREGVGRFTGLPLWTGWVGRAIRLLFFPLLLQLAFVFPGIVVGTQGFIDCVYCVGGACCIVSFS
jgi:hypothetical protein